VPHCPCAHRAAHRSGARAFWPIYEAAERHGLALAVYAGGSGGNPVTPVGAPSYYLEEYVGIANAFQGQLVSLVCEGRPGAVPGAGDRAGRVRAEPGCRR
jgi:predicted TIM-barrel fold metal-dependent hydrolase